MRRGKRVFITLIAAGLIAAICASPAAARVAYVTGTTVGAEGIVTPIDLAAELPGKAVPLGGEGAPQDVAITPDGTRAYVISFTEGGEVIPIDIATNAPKKGIGVGFSPYGIAITPDGTSAYVTAGGNVVRVDLASEKVVGTIPLGITSVFGIAITLDGTRAYVAAENAVSEGIVIPIDLATGTELPSIKVGEQPRAIAITPDGTRAYVTMRLDDTVTQINLATNTVAGTILVGDEPLAIAIAPNGARSYVLGFDSPVTPIDLGTNTAGTAINIENHFLGDVSFLPDGSKAYVTDQNQAGGNRLVPINVPADTLGTAFPAGTGPDAIAIVPNQGPHAAFTASPQTAAPGQSVGFNATASSDSDGTVARYDWNFGDGTTASNGGASPSHSYAKTGTYTVTLTTTDNEGCSATFVFTGQTAYCNGSALARTTRTVTIAPNCPKVKADAGSFVPKLKSAHVVPGVRVRLSVNSPARLSVTPTLIWSKDGDSGKVALRKVTANVDHWRRIRLAIPPSLREKLPYDTPVKVKLRIAAKPRGGSACAGTVTNRTLDLHIVKVIPNRAQSS